MTNNDCSYNDPPATYSYCCMQDPRARKQKPEHQYSPHLNVQMVATTSQHIFLHVKVDEDQLEKGLGFLQGVHVSVLLVPQQLAPPYDGRQ